MREGRSCRPESRGEWFWPAAKDERVRSGTSRKETVGAQRPEPSARISGESGSSISDGRAHSIGYKSEPDIDASAAGLGMGRVGRRGRSKGRDRDGQSISAGLGSLQVARSKVGARRPELSARISGRVVRAAATGKRIRSGTSRNETMGARRPELQARISGRVVLASGTWASAFDRDRDGRSIKGRICEIASRHGCAVQGSAESKSKADIGASAAGLAVGTVGREVKAKVEITDRDGQSIKGRTCKIAGRHRCTEPGSARSESKTDIGANAAGLAMGRVGQEVEARDEIRDRDGQSISAGLARSQAGNGALSMAEHTFAESKSDRDIGASAAGLAKGTVGQEVEANLKIRDRDGQSISAGLGSLQVARSKVGARRPELSARISGRVVRAAATGKRIRSGTSRNETMGARRPELQARISGRVVLASGTWASAFDRDRDGRSIKGRICEIASRHGCAVQGSAESKSKADIGASAAGLAVGTVGREVKAKVEITDRDGQSIKGRTCKIAGRHRCTEPGSARSESKTDIGANAAGLAMGRVGQEVEARDEIRDRDGQSISAGLARSQAGNGALSMAEHTFAESKSDRDIGASAAGLAKGTVGQEVEANLKIRDRDGQSVYAGLAMLSVGDGALSTAAQDLGKRSKSEQDIGTSAAGLAVGTVGQSSHETVRNRRSRRPIDQGPDFQCCRPASVR